MNAFALARHNMVERQLRPDGVLDRAVIAAFAAVERERFVPPRAAALAYADVALEIDAGAADPARRRAAPAPRVLARLVQALMPLRGARVLCLACGAGYACAVVARLVGEEGAVVGVEGSPTLAAQAESALAAQAESALADAPQVSVRCAPPAEGAPDLAPFDAVLIEGAVECVPDALVAQMAEGARLAAVVETSADTARAQLFVRRDGALELARVLCDAHAPPAPGFARPVRFAL